MKNQLSAKAKMTYFVSQNNGQVKVENVIATFQDYNATNVIGTLKSLTRKGILAVGNGAKITRDAVVSLTEKGEQLIAKKTMYFETI